MFKFLLTGFLLIYSFFVVGQTQKLSFSLFSADESCPSVQKKLLLYYVTESSDSLVKSDTLIDCYAETDFPKSMGLYYLVIRAKNFQEIAVSFTVSEDSPEIIDLKRLELVKKNDQLEEVTITGIKRSFIQVDADKTTITVKDNPILTVSSIYDAILKIPGVVPYPGGGFAVGGKNASIYFEGIPSNLSGDDLINLLKSLPASSVESIEIISNPGASYDANVSGAIINVVSLSRVSKWISGTITLNYGLNANNKLLPSLLLSGKNKKYSWQVQTGYSYFERSFHSTYSKNFTTFNPTAQLLSDRQEKNVNGFYYFKPSFTYKLNAKSNINVNYNCSINNNRSLGNSNSLSNELSPAVNYSNDYQSKSDGLSNEFILKYKTQFDTLKRTLELTAFYSDYSQSRNTQTIQRQSDTNDYSLLNNELKLNRFYARADLSIPFQKHKFYLQGGFKYSRLFANSLGLYNLSASTDAIFQDQTYISMLDFDYLEDNVAAYVELKKGIGKKISIGGGLRAENFNLNRKSTYTAPKSNHYFNFFPSLNAIYRISPDINLIATYARKIGIPSYSQFDPNNSGYYDNYNSSSGNPLLNPNFFSNVEVKFTVFDYLELSVDYSHSQTLNISELIVEPNSLQTVQTFRTYNNVNALTYFFSIPIPFGMFKEGLEFFNKAIDIDKINYMYLYTERTKTTVSDLEYTTPNKAMWNYGVSSQFILPLGIRMNVDYYIAMKGTYQIYQLTKPRSALEVVFTKDFLNKKLKTSLSFEDIFNTYQTTVQISYPNLNLVNYSKDDTRIIWFKVSYSFGRYEKMESDGPNIDKNGGDQNMDGLLK